MSNTQSKQATTQSSDTVSIGVTGSQDQVFQYQLDLLKIEIDLVDRSIARDEARAQNVKNFAVVVWAASITVFLGQDDLRRFVIFTASLPILFWFLDAWWTRLRMGAHVRSLKIEEFVHSQRFVDSFKERKFVDFEVLNASGSQYRNTDQFKKWSKLSRIMGFKEMLFLYGGLTAFSLILGVIALITF